LGCKKRAGVWRRRWVAMGDATAPLAAVSTCRCRSPLSRRASSCSTSRPPIGRPGRDAMRALAPEVVGAVARAGGASACTWRACEKPAPRGGTSFSSSLSLSQNRPLPSAPRPTTLSPSHVFQTHTHTHTTSQAKQAPSALLLLSPSLLVKHQAEKSRSEVRFRLLSRPLFLSAPFSRVPCARACAALAPRTVPVWSMAARPPPRRAGGLHASLDGRARSRGSWAPLLAPSLTRNTHTHTPRHLLLARRTRTGRPSCRFSSRP